LPQTTFPFLNDAFVLLHPLLWASKRLALAAVYFRFSARLDIGTGVLLQGKGFDGLMLWPSRRASSSPIL
jgi:hypothetical protein